MIMGLSMLGLIDASTSIIELEKLTKHRTLAALPFAGRYRLIDFTLSNMVNSGFTSVAIFTGKRYSALTDHLGSGKHWDLNRKRDGLFIFPGDYSRTQNGFFSFHQLKNQLSFLQRSKQEYVVISSVHEITVIDFNDVVKQHEQTKADVTRIKQGDTYLHMYVLKKNLLIKLVTDWYFYGLSSFSDVIEKNPLSLSIVDYKHTGFVEQINSIESYYSASMKLLKTENYQHLFNKTNPIYTKVKDEPSSKYTIDSLVRNSIIANGCIISGSVENSVLFRSVKIGKNTVIRNSVIMQKCVIGENCILDGVIIDKDVKIKNNVVLKGTADQLIVIPKGTVQGALV